MTNVIGNTQASEFIPEVWANRALTKLEAELHLAKNIARDSDFVATTVGSIVNIPKTGALTANQKTAGTPVTLQNPTATGVNVTIDQHWEVSFIVDDVVKAQANQSVMDRYITDGVIALAEKIETKLASLFDEATATKVNSGGGALEFADIRSMRTNLSTNRAPMTDRFLYLSPLATNDVIGMKDEADNLMFTDVSKYGTAQLIQDGELGKILGFRVYESLFVQSDGSPAKEQNLYLHKNGMVLAMRPLPTPKAGGVQVAVVDKDGLMIRVLYSYNAQELGDQVTLDTLFGCKALRSELLGVVER